MGRIAKKIKIFPRFLVTSSLGAPLLENHVGGGGGGVPRGLHLRPSPPMGFEKDGELAGRRTRETRERLVRFGHGPVCPPHLRLRRLHAQKPRIPTRLNFTIYVPECLA